MTDFRRACIVLFMVVLLAGGRASAQLSPGALSAAHQSLSGTTQCASCHKLTQGAAAFRCLECHTEITQRLASGRGLHAAQVSKTNADQDCARCHSEHKGRETSLLRWNPAPGSFDHSKTGFGLEGKHRELVCRKCHAGERIGAAERRAIRMKDLDRSFLGLPTECMDCHKDIHAAQLGKDCRHCHTAAGWKTDLHFDHATAKFPLRGAHTKLECAKCHQRPADPAAPIKFVGLAFQRCADCHRDQHHGAFTKPCESCHNVAGWKQQVALASNFDHAKTRFPLAGRHATVGCVRCHAEANFKKAVAHARCADCHQDRHNGQFARRADQGECASCHTVEGFKAARFVVADHSRTGYPLEGKHAAVACAKCHVPAGPATVYHVKHAACADCHRDTHQGQFAAAADEKRCDACHAVKGFQSTSFSLARHQKTRFPLAGGHLAVPCLECHKIEPAGEAKRIRFRFENRTCAGCHADPHNGQFAQRMNRRLPNGSVPGCEACHTNQSWKDLARFDHSGTDFHLLGRHRSVACIDCHRPANLSVQLKDAVFQAAPKLCAGCHEEPHGGQFNRAGKVSACNDCHNTMKWKPSLFDHARRAQFPLEGAHRDVRCAACHKSTRLVASKSVLVYKPTPRKCIECHGAAPAAGGS